jgi:dTDP-glucose pyrophosphorylase
VTDDHLASLYVPETASVRDAMAAMTQSAREVALVIDREGRVAGLITDGDIRRGLLGGCDLDSPVSAVMTRDFFFVSPETDRAYVLDIMRARLFRHVPVLDEQRRPVAVHFLRDLIGGAPKPNTAVILAGGKGTRLRPFTDFLPKPMVEVAGRPMLERLILHLVGHGITKIFLSVNFKAEVIEDHFGDGASFGCRIEYLRENTPLGTGGPLTLLSPRPKHPILVLNGDLVTNTDLAAMLQMHMQGGYAATIAVGPHQVQIPFGAVTERHGVLVQIEEKPTVNFLVNRGIYVLEPHTIDLIPRGEDFPITALFDRLASAQHRVGVFYTSGSWMDVGAPDDLRRARGFV